MLFRKKQNREGGLSFFEQKIIFFSGPEINEISTKSSERARERQKNKDFFNDLFGDTLTQQFEQITEGPRSINTVSANGKTGFYIVFDGETHVATEIKERTMKDPDAKTKKKKYIYIEISNIKFNQKDLNDIKKLAEKIHGIKSIEYKKLKGGRLAINIFPEETVNLDEISLDTGFKVAFRLRLETKRDQFEELFKNTEDTVFDSKGKIKSGFFTAKRGNWEPIFERLTNEADKSALQAIKDKVYSITIEDGKIKVVAHYKNCDINLEERDAFWNKTWIAFISTQYPQPIEEPEFVEAETYALSPEEVGLTDPKEPTFEFAPEEADSSPKIMHAPEVEDPMVYAEAMPEPMYEESGEPQPVEPDDDWEPYVTNEDDFIDQELGNKNNKPTEPDMPIAVPPPEKDSQEAEAIIVSPKNNPEAKLRQPEPPKDQKIPSNVLIREMATNKRPLIQENIDKLEYITPKLAKMIVDQWNNESKNRLEFKSLKKLKTKEAKEFANFKGSKVDLRNLDLDHTKVDTIMILVNTNFEVDLSGLSVDFYDRLNKEQKELIGRNLHRISFHSNLLRKFYQHLPVINFNPKELTFDNIKKYNHKVFTIGESTENEEKNDHFYNIQTKTTAISPFNGGYNTYSVTITHPNSNFQFLFYLETEENQTVWRYRPTITSFTDIEKRGKRFAIISEFLRNNGIIIKNPQEIEAPALSAKQTSPQPEGAPLTAEPEPADQYMEKPDPQPVSAIQETLSTDDLIKEMETEKIKITQKNIDKLEYITPKLAKMIVEKWISDGEYVLALSNLKKLAQTEKETIKVAEELANFKGEILALGGLKEITPDIAEKLANFKGDALVLGGLKEITPDIAEKLANFKGTLLRLDGLKKVSHNTIVALINFTNNGPRKAICLYGIRSPNSISVESLISLAKSNFEKIYLGDISKVIDTMTDEQKKIIATNLKKFTFSPNYCKYKLLPYTPLIEDFRPQEINFDNINENDYKSVMINNHQYFVEIKIDTINFLNLNTKVEHIFRISIENNDKIVWDYIKQANYNVINESEAPKELELVHYLQEQGITINETQPEPVKMLE